MVKPSLSSLMEKENVNRYTLVVATAKCAREITDEYIRQRIHHKNAQKQHGGQQVKPALAVGLFFCRSRCPGSNRVASATVGSHTPRRARRARS